MKTLIHTLLIILLASSFAFAQRGWNQQHEESDVILYSVDMLDANTITAVGVDGYLLHSNDGGEHWSKVDAGTDSNLRRVRWHSASLGVILGNGGLAMKSTDRGSSWTALNTGTSDALFDIHFFDADNWLVVGQKARTLTTSDGGVTWDDEGASVNNYNEIAFRGDFGIIVGNKATIRVTNNGGEKWRSRSSPSSFELTSVSIGDDSTAIIVGVNGVILRTTDYGLNWEQVYASVPISALRLTGVRHLTRDRAVIVGYGGIILESVDAGANWTPQVSNTQKNLEAVAFTNDKVGTAAGWDGTLMRTTSGGTLGVKRSTFAVPTGLRVHAAWPQPISRSRTSKAHVRFDLPSTGNVELRVYDLLGQQRRSLLSRRMEAGTWDIDWNPAGLAKGVYLYHLSVGTHARTKKFVVID